MKIERALLSDMEQILHIQKKSYISQAEIYDDYTIHPIVETLSQAVEDFAIKQIFKAVIDNRIVAGGRVLVKDNTCHIGMLFVDQDFQGRGIGTKILCFIEETFSDYKRLELFTGDRSLDNIRLYERLGYKKYKMAKYSDKADIIYMEKYR